ncbi:MAG: Type II secretion system protein [Candidatus Collierbacteria bacterium GW2011_GWB2_42_12]|nr:MAG: Type II secretion system protein [Candidatus Collierbacteria bacterium GW2011_GWB2_42_12]
MKAFNYKVRDQKGNASSGVMEATDQKQVVSILRGKGMIITSLTEADQLNFDSIFGKFSKPKQDEITNFTRQLATMVGAGLPLVNALKILKMQSTPALKTVIEKVSTVYIAMVRAGESAGVLDQVLKKLADALDKQREFRSKTKGAMVYPMIVSIGMVVIGAIMMVFVVPKLTAMYKDFGAELPTPTRILMGISDIVVRFWYGIAIVVALASVLIGNWAKTEVGSLIVEQLTFRIPIWGKLRKDIILTEFARTVSVLLGAGIPILDTLQIVSETLGSKVYGAEVRQAAVLVEKGVSLAEAIQSLEVFPPILGQMISVGEETGKLDEVLAKLATFYEGESETKIKALTTAIEPMIMIVMGIGVGFLVIAVIMPIYNLTSQF